MIFERRGLPDGPWDWEPGAPRLLALRAGLRALPFRGNLHPMNPGPAGVEEMDRLRLLALRGALAAWASALYPGVEPDALARAAAALDDVTASLDAGYSTFSYNCGYGSDYHIGAIMDQHDCALQAIRWVREALADPPRILSGGWFDTLKFFGPESWENYKCWHHLQTKAFEADAAVLARNEGSAEAVRALAAAPLWPDSRSADAAAILTDDTCGNLVGQPGPLGDHAVRWLEARMHGALDPAGSPAAERLVRIANLPDFFWDAGPADDVGRALDRLLGGEPANPAAGGAPLPLRGEGDGADRTTKTGMPGEDAGTTSARRELPGGRWHWELLAQRSGLYALPAHPHLHPMNPGPAGVEEICRLRLLTLRGALAVWASALHPGVEPGARERAAAALDAVTASVDAGRARFDGYSSAYMNTSVEDEHDRARGVIRSVRGALADPQRILAYGGYRLQEAALEADWAMLAPAERRADVVRAVAAARLWFAPGSAGATEYLTAWTWDDLVRDPGPLGAAAVRWLEERMRGGLDLALARSPAVERLVRIAHLPDSFWDAGPADDVGRVLDDFLGSEPASP